MTVNRVKRRGSYAPLSVNYYKDDALADAGPMAELLFCRGLAFCAETLSDGYISDTQLVRFVGVGIPNPVKHAEKLATVRGADKSPWIKADGGYMVRSWLNWNASAEDIRKKQQEDLARKLASSKAGKATEDAN